MSSVAKAKRPMSAGRAKKVAKNSLVHIISREYCSMKLFPRIHLSFRGEVLTSNALLHGLTFSNYTRLFTETTLLNFRTFLYCCFSVLMYHFNSICTFCCVLYVTTEI